MENKQFVRNQDSTARDHLANERTYLAWVRTSLGFVGLGLFISKLIEAGRLLTEVAGFCLVLYGAAGLVYAIVRYERVAHLLLRGEFRVAKRGPFVLGVAGLLVAVGAFVLVLASA